MKIGLITQQFVHTVLEQYLNSRLHYNSKIPQLTVIHITYSHVVILNIIVSNRFGILLSTKKIDDQNSSRLQLYFVNETIHFIVIFHFCKLPLWSISQMIIGMDRLGFTPIFSRPKTRDTFLFPIIFITQYEMKGWI